MREIKFRGWNTISNIMVDEISVFTPQETYNLNDSFNKDMTVLPLQFTGLKDKNGKEIYEGDIIEADNGSKTDVVWEGPSFIALADSDEDGVSQNYVYFTDECRVIGNIYENPELLNSNKKKEQ